MTYSRLFYAKSSLYIYIRYIWFGWVRFYGISSIVGYLMLNPFYTYIFSRSQGGKMHVILDTIINVAFVLCFVTIFTNPSASAGYDTRSIFKRSLTGLNSEFSCCQTSYLTKAEELSLTWRENNWIHTFVKCDQPRPGFELVSPWLFPTTRTITPRALLMFCYWVKREINLKYLRILGSCLREESESKWKDWRIPRSCQRDESESRLLLDYWM